MLHTVQAAGGLALTARRMMGCPTRHGFPLGRTVPPGRADWLSYQAGCATS